MLLFVVVVVMQSFKCDPFRVLSFLNHNHWCRYTFWNIYQCVCIYMIILELSWAATWLQRHPSTWPSSLAWVPSSVRPSPIPRLNLARSTTHRSPYNNFHFIFVARLISAGSAMRLNTRSQPQPKSLQILVVDAQHTVSSNHLIPILARLQICLPWHYQRIKIVGKLDQFPIGTSYNWYCSNRVQEWDKFRTNSGFHTVLIFHGISSE